MQTQRTSLLVHLASKDMSITVPRRLEAWIACLPPYAIEQIRDHKTLRFSAQSLSIDNVKHKPAVKLSPYAFFQLIFFYLYNSIDIVGFHWLTVASYRWSSIRNVYSALILYQNQERIEVFHGIMTRIFLIQSKKKQVA